MRPNERRGVSFQDLLDVHRQRREEDLRTRRVYVDEQDKEGITYGGQKKGE
jgi:hypothetical protein